MTRVFTSVIVLRDNKILILKRRDDDVIHPSLWDCVGGHFEGSESAEDNVYRESREEIGVNIEIIKAGNVYEINDESGRQLVIPFLCTCKTDDIKISPEHTEYKWIDPNEIKNYKCVPDLLKDLELFGLI